MNFFDFLKEALGLANQKEESIYTREYKKSGKITYFFDKEWQSAFPKLELKVRNACEKILKVKKIGYSLNFDGSTIGKARIIVKLFGRSASETFSVKADIWSESEVGGGSREKIKFDINQNLINNITSWITISIDDIIQKS